MLSVTEKIRIVNKLSSLFGSYDELSFLCKYLENNPECIFYFLRLVTSFEVLIINMNKKTLNRIAEYCITLTNDNNLPCMEGINKFVKARIKREK